MLNKEEILKVLEKERQFAIKVNEPKMALGISQAIKVIKDMQETIKVESGLCIVCGDDGEHIYKNAVYCRDCVPID